VGSWRHGVGTGSSYPAAPVVCRSAPTVSRAPFGRVTRLLLSYLMIAATAWARSPCPIRRCDAVMAADEPTANRTPSTAPPTRCLHIRPSPFDRARRPAPLWGQLPTTPRAGLTGCSLGLSQPCGIGVALGRPGEPERECRRVRSSSRGGRLAARRRSTSGLRPATWSPASLDHVDRVHPLGQRRDKGEARRPTRVSCKWPPVFWARSPTSRGGRAGLALPPLTEVAPRATREQAACLCPSSTPPWFAGPLRSPGGTLGGCRCGGAPSVSLSGHPLARCGPPARRSVGVAASRAATTAKEKMSRAVGVLTYCRTMPSPMTGMDMPM
jgi:hypothetical protein